MNKTKKKKKEKKTDYLPWLRRANDGLIPVVSPRSYKYMSFQLTPFRYFFRTAVIYVSINNIYIAILGD